MAKGSTTDNYPQICARKMGIIYAFFSHSRYWSATEALLAIHIKSSTWFTGYYPQA